jgi:hypothetical protein
MTRLPLSNGKCTPMKAVCWFHSAVGEVVTL